MTLTEYKILLVDDEKRLLDSISKRISLLGFTPLKALSGMQAIDIARHTPVDLAIVDLKMPDMDGLVTITRLKEIIPDLRTVLMTGYGSEKVKQATQALGALYVEKDAMGGLWDYIKKSGYENKVIVIKPSPPFPEHPPGNLIFGTASHFYSDLGHTGHHLNLSLPKIIGETLGIQRLRKNIQRLAEMDCAVIIRGESGTGKELAARTIHGLSHRRNQLFLAFDCGCFSQDFGFTELISSLEGTSEYERSIQAPSDKEQMSFAGTILLDHMENMPEQTQQEMMSLLDRRSNTIGPLMDIRFIMAPHPNSRKKGKEEGFQKELYRRIRAIELEVPSLRDRMEDLPTLCYYFLYQLNEEFGKSIKSFSDDVFHALEPYPFPGNIRELRSMIERAVILADGEIITCFHLPDRLKPGHETHPLNQGKGFLTIRQMEQKHILKAIEITKGNKSKAAELLGISRGALWRKLRIIAEESA